MRRREVLKLFTAAALSGVVPCGIGRAAEADDLYGIGKFGNARVLHMTDTHAQLTPVHFREPSVNLGVGDHGRPAAASGRRRLSQIFRHRAERAGSRTPSPISISPRPRTAMAGSAASPI